MKPEPKAWAVSNSGKVWNFRRNPVEGWKFCIPLYDEQAILTARQEGRAEAFEEAEQIAIANAHADCEVAEAIAREIRKAGEA